MRLTGESVWAWAQGLGLGMLFGVIIASGFGFDAEDSARFVGGLVGALIAVAGAVSLHFFTKASSVTERRSLVSNSLRDLVRFNEGIITKLDSGEGHEVSAGLRVTQRFVERVKRQCQAYETVDDRISVALGLIENVRDNSYLRHLRDDNDYSDGPDEIVKAIVVGLDKSYRRAISYVDEGVNR